MSDELKALLADEYLKDQHRQSGVIGVGPQPAIGRIFADESGGLGSWSANCRCVLMPAMPSHTSNMMAWTLLEEDPVQPWEQVSAEVLETTWMIEKPDAMARGQYCLVAAKLTSSHARHEHEIGMDIVSMTYTLLAFLAPPGGPVTSHMIRNARWSRMQEMSEEPFMQAPTMHHNLQDWLDGLCRDIDHYMLMPITVKDRQVKVEIATAGGECDVIKWQQSHRTPLETVASLKEAGISLYVSHTEPWAMSRYQEDGDSLGMGFVAVCAIGHGAKAIKELRMMGYRCKILRYGKPEIPGLVGLDQRLVDIQDDRRDGASLRTIGRGRAVEEIDMGDLEI